MNGLGAYIRQQRNERDLSLRAFAKRLELSPSYISDIELGLRHPSKEALENMAKILGVSADQLRAQDDRAPIEEIKARANIDPRFAVALRTIIDQNISADELLRLLEKKGGRKPKH